MNELPTISTQALPSKQALTESLLASMSSSPLMMIPTQLFAIYKSSTLLESLLVFGKQSSAHN
jgi:hypothetical protein